MYRNRIIRQLNRVVNPCFYLNLSGKDFNNSVQFDRKMLSVHAIFENVANSSIDNDKIILFFKQTMTKENKLFDDILKGNENSWKEFINRYSNYIYAAIVRYTDDYDEKMSIYIFILEKIKENNFRRLRQFCFRSSLSTWLTVISRNLALDFLRKQYGKDFRYKQKIINIDDQLQNLRLEGLVVRENPESIFQSEKRREMWIRLLKEMETIFSNLDNSEVLLLKMVFYKGMKIKDAGNILRIQHVYKFLNKTLNNVKIQLVDRFEMEETEWDFLFRGEWA